MTNPLTNDQVDRFMEDGFLLVENALSPDQLSALNTDFETWVEESRQYASTYGETIDGRARFDVEPGHCAETPAVRRISSPVEISDNYLEAMRNNRALDAVAQLFNPNIKFINCKVNSKLPGTATEVKYHQDFLFETHSNDNLMTVLFFLDDVTMENGPLEVVPGSHVGPLYEHWHGGVFTGAITQELEDELRPKAVHCTGPAGSACLMHTRLVHGSNPNNSNNPRTLFIVSYGAEDAQSLITNHIPSIYDGEIVRGVSTNRVRTTPFEMAIPEYPKEASFFNQQARLKA